MAIPILDGLAPQFGHELLAKDALAQVAVEFQEQAKQDGKRLFIKSVVRELDGSERWAGKMVDLLCAMPELAAQSNDVLMLKVSEALGLSESLSGNRMSKQLSRGQRDVAETKLSQAGYSVVGIQKGTDIKRIIKEGIKLCTNVETRITTTFQADGIVIDGHLRKYRRRDITPTGCPWHDFNVRFCNSEIPLEAVLTMRGIGTGEFQSADAAACARASEDERKGRDSITREGIQHPQLQRVISSVHRFPKLAEYEELATEDTARAWWRASPMRRETNAFWNFANYLRGEASNPERVKQIMDAFHCVDDLDDDRAEQGNHPIEEGQA